MPRVVVYSRDSIRGRIVSKTLGLEGIRAAPRINHFETWEVIHDHAPRVIIVDARKNIPGEKSFLSTLSRRLPGSKLILLISPGDGSDFEELALPNIRRVDDPFDPEALLSAVREDLTPPPPPVKKWTRHVAPLLSWSAARVLKTIPILVTLVIGVILGYLYWCIDTLPEIDDMAEYAPYEASRVFSSDNVLLTEFYVERRTFISLDRIPEHVRNAFIAVEDARFFEHNGIDIRRIIGALAANIKEGGYVQGGSTITQQLAKLRFLKPEKTLTRKIQEIALSLQIE
ncbi:MAG: hypothetical protein GY859_08720, partial [Desulfobacterales bacterium]|nr:hypothetical protein [Desulfobacterales bacterium]